MDIETPSGVTFEPTQDKVDFGLQDKSLYLTRLENRLDKDEYISYLLTKKGFVPKYYRIRIYT